MVEEIAASISSHAQFFLPTKDTKESISNRSETLLEPKKKHITKQK